MSITGSDAQPDKWGAQELMTPSGTLEWYADLSGLSTSGGSEDAFLAEIENAFQLWSDVAAVDFARSDTLSTGVDISFTVARLEGIAPTLDNIEDAAGLASRSLISGSEVDTIVDVDIYFDTDLTWSLGGNFFKVTAHEIGHGLGLEHIHDPAEIMNPTVFVEDLGVQDIAAVRSLYGTEDSGGNSDDPTPVENESSEMSASDGGGGAGGLGILALLAGIMAFFFGGSGAGVAVAALGQVEDDDDIPDPDFEDLPPMIETDQHLVFLEGHGNWHGYGCGCSHCAMETELSDDIFA